MTYEPTPETLPQSHVVSTLSDEFAALLQGGTYGTSANWPTANLAYFYPFRFRQPFSCVKGFVQNGATPAGNFDMGWYDLDGNRLASVGSTAQAGASNLQLVDLVREITEDVLYLAVASDSTSFQLLRTNSFTGLPLTGAGIRQMASAFPLPSVATFADVATGYLPIVGASKASFL